MNSLICLISAVILQVHSFKIDNIPSFSSQSSTLQETCNITHYDYMGLGMFANSRYFTRALSYYETLGSSKIQGFGYRVNSTTTYYIQNVSYKLTYLEDNQTASFGQNQVILIQGGKLSVEVHFKWSYENKATQPEIFNAGNATAKAITKEIPYSINISRSKTSEQNFITWTGLDLYQYSKINFGDFDIPEIDCKYYDPKCTVTETDISTLKYMLSKIPSNITPSIKNRIETPFNQYFGNALSNVICCNNSATYPNSTYTWKAYTKSIYDEPINHTFPRQNLDLFMDKTGPKPGIYVKSLILPGGQSEGKCGPVPTNASLDLNIYGGSQEFISLTVFQNLLRQGIKYKQLDTVLNSTFWTTNTFQFYVGDLETVIANITQVIPSYTEIKGSCSASPNNISVKKGSINSTLKIFTTYNCYLNTTNSVKLIEFSLNLTSEVNVRFLFMSLDVWLKSYTFDVAYNDNFGFKLTNKTQANLLIKNSLERLHENKLFGSGWYLNLGQRNPALLVTDTAILIYDKFKRTYEK